MCQKNFGILEAGPQPDEFFGMFDTFLASMKDAKLENEKIKKQKEEEEKRAQLEEKVRKISNLDKVKFRYKDHSKLRSPSPLRPLV